MSLEISLSLLFAVERFEIAASDLDAIRIPSEGFETLSAKPSPASIRGFDRALVDPSNHGGGERSDRHERGANGQYFLSRSLALFLSDLSLVFLNFVRFDSWLAQFRNHYLV